jgi:hypothetical protein
MTIQGYHGSKQIPLHPMSVNIVAALTFFHELSCCAGSYAAGSWSDGLSVIIYPSLPAAIIPANHKMDATKDKAFSHLGQIVYSKIPSPFHM